MMGNLQFNKEGMIKGGVCDREHRLRNTREIGANIYIEYLKDMKIIKENKGNIVLKRKTTRTFPNAFQLHRKGILPTGQHELGAYRATDVFEALCEAKIFKISRKKFNSLLDKSTAPISNLGAALALISKQKDPKLPIAADHIYKKRKARGEF